MTSLLTRDVDVLQNMTDESVISISEGCPGLVSLCLSNCSRLTDASLVALAQKCHQLR